MIEDSSLKMLTNWATSLPLGFHITQFYFTKPIIEMFDMIFAYFTEIKNANMILLSTDNMTKTYFLICKYSL